MYSEAEPHNPVGGYNSRPGSRLRSDICTALPIMNHESMNEVTHNKRDKQVPAWFWASCKWSSHPITGFLPNKTPEKFSPIFENDQIA